MLDDLGSVEWAKQASRQLAQAAHLELSRAFPDARPSPDLDLIYALPSFVTERDM